MAQKKSLEVGIDFGCTSFVTLSNGQTFEYPKQLKKLRKDIARAAGRLRSKDAVGHKGVLRRKLAKLRATFEEKTFEFIETLVLKLVSRFHFFYVEDINKERMLRMGAVKTAAKMPWRKFIDRLRQECQSRGKIFVLVPAANTSRKCSNCGHIKLDLQLSHRTYLCIECGHQMCRDQNAALNIQQQGKEIFNAETSTKTKSRSVKG